MRRIQLEIQKFQLTHVCRICQLRSYWFFWVLRQGRSLACKCRTASTHLRDGSLRRETKPDKWFRSRGNWRGTRSRIIWQLQSWEYSVQSKTRHKSRPLRLWMCLTGKSKERSKDKEWTCKHLKDKAGARFSKNSTHDFLIGLVTWSINDWSQRRCFDCCTKWLSSVEIKTVKNKRY